jgi:hypothetical protein
MSEMRRQRRPRSSSREPEVAVESRGIDVDRSRIRSCSALTRMLIRRWRLEANYPIRIMYAPGMYSPSRAERAPRLQRSEPARASASARRPAKFSPTGGPKIASVRVIASWSRSHASTGSSALGATAEPPLRNIS